MKDGAFDIKVTINVPDAVAYRCLRILEMWLNDHPECCILGEKVDVGGCFENKLTIKRWSDDGEEQIPGIRHRNDKQE